MTDQELRIHKNFRLPRQTLDNADLVSRQTGQTTTGVLESAVSDYSLKWMLIEKFIKRPETAALYLDMLDTTQRMLRGKPEIKEWDEPLMDLLRAAAAMATLNYRGAVKQQRKENFVGMLERLQNEIGVLIEEVNQA